MFLLSNFTNYVRTHLGLVANCISKHMNIWEGKYFSYFLSQYGSLRISKCGHSSDFWAKGYQFHLSVYAFWVCVVYEKYWFAIYKVKWSLRMKNLEIGWNCRLYMLEAVASKFVLYQHPAFEFLLWSGICTLHDTDIRRWETFNFYVEGLVTKFYAYYVADFCREFLNMTSAASGL